MALAYDTATNSATADGSQTALSWSHTCTGSNLILIVGLSFRTLGSVPTNVAVTYNGVGMTQVSTTQSAGVTASAMFYLANPATGSNTVAASWTNNNWCVGGAASFTGSAGTVGTPATFGSTSTTNPTVTVTSATGEIVIDTMATAGASSETAGANQTARWNFNTTPNQCSGSGSTEAGASSVVMDWTLGSTDQAVQIGVSIQAPASAFPYPQGQGFII